MSLRRASDRHKVVQTVVGIAVSASGIYLRVRQPTMSDWLVIALVGGGMAMMDRQFLADLGKLVLQWFNRHTPGPPTPSA